MPSTHDMTLPATDPVELATWLMSTDSTSGHEQALMGAFADLLTGRGWEVTRIPVFIAGGGPVGLAMALLLDRFGVDCVVVEKSATTEGR